MSMDWMRQSWPGGGPHDGHTISPIERWPAFISDQGVLTCGRVRCSCGAEWAVGGWPSAIANAMYEAMR